MALSGTIWHYFGGPRLSATGVLIEPRSPFDLSPEPRLAACSAPARTRAMVANLTIGLTGRRRPPGQRIRFVTLITDRWNPAGCDNMAQPGDHAPGSAVGIDRVARIAPVLVTAATVTNLRDFSSSAAVDCTDFRRLQARCACNLQRFVQPSKPLAIFEAPLRSSKPPCDLRSLPAIFEAPCNLRGTNHRFRGTRNTINHNYQINN